MNKTVAQLLHENPRLLLLSIMIIVAAGVSAWFVIPRLEDPESNTRGTFIFTRMPGAPATRVESQVTRPIEDAVRGERYVKKLISESRNSISWIMIELTDDATDLDAIWTRVQTKLTEVEPDLPPESSAPQLIKDEWGSYSLFVTLSCSDSVLDQDLSHEALLARYSKELKSRLQFLSGTSHVRNFGVANEEVVVSVDPFELASLNLTAAQIGRRIFESEKKTSAGAQRGTETDVSLGVAGEINTIDRLRQIRVKESTAGNSLELSDIANVQKTIQSPADSIVTVDGRRSTIIAARAFPKIQIDQWATRVDTVLEEFESTLPRGMKMDQVFEQVSYTRERWESLGTSLLLGLVSIVAIVWLLMGFRAMTPIVLSLPLSMAIILFLMAMAGVSLQQISFIGVVIALGLLIDNPIIIVDELQHQPAIQSVSDSISKTIRVLFVPLAGASLTTIFAFAPLMLIEGAVGEYLWTLGAAVIFAILASLGLSIWLVPAIAARLGNVGGSSNGILSPPLCWLVKQIVSRVLLVPWLGVLLPISLALLGFWLATGIPELFFPPAERNQVRLELRLPRVCSIDETLQQTESASRILQSVPGFRRVTWFVGSNAPSFYYNMFGGGDGSPFNAEAMIELDDIQFGQPFAIAAQRKLSQQLPTAQAIIRQIEQGPAVMSPIEIRIFGEDLETILRLGEQFRKTMTTVDSITQTRATIESGQPRMQFSVDESLSSQMNLLSRDISRQLGDRTDGIVLGSLIDSTEELPIRVKLNDAFQSWETIFSLPLNRSNSVDNSNAQSNGHSTMLRAIAKPQLVPEYGALTRYNGRRCNIVRAYLLAGALPSVALDDLKSAIQRESIAIPPDCHIEFGGDDEERNRAVKNLLAYTGILFVAMISALVWTVSSFRLAATVCLVGVLSVGYSMGALYFSGYPFGFMAIVGTMGMVGIAINDSVVVIAALRNHALETTVTRQSVQDVVVSSSRHVLATTLTTTAGFVPLMISDSEFWSPVAVVIIGGVLAATILSLVLVPSTFLLLYRR